MWFFLDIVLLSFQLWLNVQTIDTNSRWWRFWYWSFLITELDRLNPVTNASFGKATRSWSRPAGSTQCTHPKIRSSSAAISFTISTLLCNYSTNTSYSDRVDWMLKKRKGGMNVWIIMLIGIARCRVYAIEKSTEAPLRFRYPFFETIHWFAAERLVDDLKDMNSQGTRCPEHLIIGVRALLVSLKSWSLEKSVKKTLNKSK